MGDGGGDGGSGDGGGEETVVRKEAKGGGEIEGSPGSERGDGIKRKVDEREEKQEEEKASDSPRLHRDDRFVSSASLNPPSTLVRQASIHAAKSGK